MIASLLLAVALQLPVISGTYNPAVKQSTIRQTICVHGWTATIRPPVSFTASLKRRQIVTLHLSGSTRDYEEDHLISLELGGSPRSEQNLWPQPWSQARSDDRHENIWKTDVCAGRLTLRQGRLAERRWKLRYG